MNPLRSIPNLKIGTRVYAGFGFMLVLVAALGALGTTAFKSAEGQLSGLIRTSGNATKVAEINGDLINARRQVYRFAINGSGQERDGARETMARLKDETAAVFQTTQDPVRKEKLGAVAKLATEYAAHFESAVALHSERTKLGATLDQAGPKTAAELERLIDAISAEPSLDFTAEIGKSQKSLFDARLVSSGVNFT
jgi:methyl-accepting chemotaxis protein